MKFDFNVLNNKNIIDIIDNDDNIILNNILINHNFHNCIIISKKFNNYNKNLKFDILDYFDKYKKYILTYILKKQIFKIYNNLIQFKKSLVLFDNIKINYKDDQHINDFLNKTIAHKLLIIIKNYKLIKNNRSYNNYDYIIINTKYIIDNTQEIYKYYIYIFGNYQCFYYNIYVRLKDYDYLIINNYDDSMNKFMWF